MKKRMVLLIIAGLVPVACAELMPDGGFEGAGVLSKSSTIAFVNSVGKGSIVGVKDLILSPSYSNSYRLGT